MEDLLGFAIFFLFAIVGVISKIREQRQETKQREERRAQRVRPEELPEKTRQIFYGSEGNPGRAKETRQAEIPMAKPRSAPPEGPVTRPVAMPSFGGKEVAGREIPVPPRRPPVAPAASPSQAETLQEAWRRTQEQQRQQSARPLPQRRAMPPEQRQQTQTTLQQMWQQAQQRQAAVPPQPQRRAQAQPRPVPVPVRDSEAPDGELNVAAVEQVVPGKAAPQAPARQRRSAAERLFSSGRNVRYGIMMKEILNPPRALRDYGSKY